jgi:hypothetical protein
MSQRMPARNALIPAAILAALAAPAFPQATAPTTTTAPASAPVELQAFISGVQGSVRVRQDENSPWQIAKEGMELGAGAEFQTAPRSAVQIELPPDQIITLDRLGQMKLLEALQVGKRVKTDVGMKYGRVHYAIEAAGLAHDGTIHSPGAALAIRGTDVILEDCAPFAPRGVSLTGQAQFRNARRQMVKFGSKGKGKTTIASDNLSAAQSAMASAMLTSPALQYTEQQMRELNYLFSHQNGGLLGNVATSTHRVSDRELPQLFGGPLDFVLRWSAPGGADLNIFVNTPLNETFGNPPFIYSFFPGNTEIGQALADAGLPQSTPSGGHVGLNHIGPQGIEIASFAADYPRGRYVVGAYNFIRLEDVDTTGLPKVPFTIEVFLDGKKQEVILNLQQVLAGKEQPRCGLVYRDEIAIGELAATALLIPAPRSLCEAATQGDRAQARSLRKESKASQKAIELPKSPALAGNRASPNRTPPPSRGR